VAGALGAPYLRSSRSSRPGFPRSPRASKAASGRMALGGPLDSRTDAFVTLIACQGGVGTNPAVPTARDFLRSAPTEPALVSQPVRRCRVCRRGSLGPLDLHTNGSGPETTRLEFADEVRVDLQELARHRLAFDQVGHLRLDALVTPGDRRDGRRRRDRDHQRVAHPGRGRSRRTDGGSQFLPVDAAAGDVRAQTDRSEVADRGFVVGVHFRWRGFASEARGLEWTRAGSHRGRAGRA
jgi:hypothetical protein